MQQFNMSAIKKPNAKTQSRLIVRYVPTIIGSFSMCRVTLLRFWGRKIMVGNLEKKRLNKLADLTWRYKKTDTVKKVRKQKKTGIFVEKTAGVLLTAYTVNLRFIHFIL